MLTMILTALAGIAVGVVGMRIWQQRRSDETQPHDPNAMPASGLASLNRTKVMLVGAGVLLVAAVGVVLFKPGSEEAVGAESTAFAMNEQADKLDDVDTMIERLAARLEQNPNDGEGFRMLGWSYLMTGRPDQALAPFERAVELLPQNASAQSGYGEALVATNEGQVTPKAREAFEKALAIDPSEPRARYFRGRGLMQDGERMKALNLWIDLANSGPPDSPWQGDVRRDIETLAGELNVDVSDRLKASPALATSGQPPALDPVTVQAASSLPLDEQNAMIERMVEGLAARLKTNPDDSEGWARLLRSRMVRGQVDLAKADLVTARNALAGDQRGLALVNATAREVGVP